MNGENVLSIVVMEQNKEVEYATVIDVLEKINNRRSALSHFVLVCTLKVSIKDKREIRSASKE